jgi:hypothetical protein
VKLQQVQEMLNWIRNNSDQEFSVSIYNDVYTVNKYLPEYDDWSEEMAYGGVQQVELNLGRKIYNIMHSHAVEIANESGLSIDIDFDLAIADRAKEFLKEEFGIVI